MNRLFKINKMCILATESNEEAGISYNATANDAAIFISYRGGTQKFVDCARTLKANHCPIITLTADVRTTLTDLADIRLTIPDREHAADNIGTFYSQAAFDYVLNVGKLKEHDYAYIEDEMTQMVRTARAAGICVKVIFELT